MSSGASLGWQAVNGQFYGTTLNGGISARGVVYSLAGPATVTLGNLSQVYDGTPRYATVTTTPPALALDIAYQDQFGNSVSAPTDAGFYLVTALVTDPAYPASATGTLEIRKATATLAFDTLAFVYDALPKPVSVTTSPTGLSGVTVAYHDGSTTAPTDVGAYPVSASLSHRNYEASDATGVQLIQDRTFFTAPSAAALLSNLPATGDGTGFSVAIDGTTAVVGAPGSDVSGVTDAGAVFVFERDAPGSVGGQWGLVATLMLEASGPSPARPTDQLGWSVDISGTTVVAGARLREAHGATSGNHGTVWVFDLTAPDYNPTELTAPDAGRGDSFGFSVAIHNSTMVVGAPGYDRPPHDINDNAGKAYLFDTSTGSWAFAAALGEGSIADARFGGSVALDDELAVVGAAGGKLGLVDVPGTATVFDPLVPDPATGWTAAATLSQPADPTALFGLAVAVSGASVIVGAPGSSQYAGAAHVFLRDPSGVFTETVLVPTDSTANIRFGQTVAIAGDGCVADQGQCTAVVGAGFTGHAAYVFDRVDDRVWGLDHDGDGLADETQKLASPAGNGDAITGFGHGLAMSGQTLVVGAAYQDFDNPSDGFGLVLDRGAAFVFSEDAIIAPDADVQTDPDNLGVGVVIEAGAFVAPGVTIGDGALIKTGATIEEGATVGEFATVGALARVGEGATVGVSVVLGDQSLVGAGSTVGAGTQVGSRTFLRNNVMVGTNSQLGDNIRVFSGAVLGDSVSIGNLTDIRTNVVIGDGVSIGVDGDIGARTQILPGSQLGNNVTIHAGTFLGVNVTVGDETEIHRAVVEDDVVIGLRVFVGNNVTIFAGSTVPDDTVIPNGCTAMPIAGGRNCVES